MNDYLKMRRKMLGLTQDQVARLSGISQNAYSEIELGHYMPRLFVAFKIGRVLNATVDDLFTDIYLDAIALTDERIKEYEKESVEK